MADSVARYLVLNHEIPASASRWWAWVTLLWPGKRGLGEQTGGNRVAISVLKNGVEQVASTPGSDSSAPPK